MKVIKINNDHYNGWKCAKMPKNKNIHVYA